MLTPLDVGVGIAVTLLVLALARTPIVRQAVGLGQQWCNECARKDALIGELLQLNQRLALEHSRTDTKLREIEDRLDRWRADHKSP